MKKAGWFEKSPAFLAGDFLPPWKALLIMYKPSRRPAEVSAKMLNQHPPLPPKKLRAINQTGVFVVRRNHEKEKENKATREYY